MRALLASLALLLARSVDTLVIGGGAFEDTLRHLLEHFASVGAGDPLYATYLL